MHIIAKYLRTYTAKKESLKKSHKFFEINWVRTLHIDFNVLLKSVAERGGGRGQQNSFAITYTYFVVAHSNLSYKVFDLCLS